MGMDVYGKAPTGEAGEYFRRSVWGWHPLWRYVEDCHPELAQKVEHGHSNDGDGLNADDSVTLAALLENDIKNGKAESYIGARNRALEEMGKEECQYCNGTGSRTDEIGRLNGLDKPGGCNGCRGEGKVSPIDSWYVLELDDIKEFAAFLAECGGFQIH